MKNLLISVVIGAVVSLIGFSACAKSADVNAESRSGKQPVWFTDWERASDQARQSNRTLFALFTGSDWCPWCVKLQKEILSTKDFRKFAGRELVLFKADFTRNPRPDPALERANTALMDQFGVRGFPTVILLSPAGKPIGKTGYVRGGPDPFLKQLKNTLNKK